MVLCKYVYDLFSREQKSWAADHNAAPCRLFSIPFSFDQSYDPFDEDMRLLE